MLKKSLGLYILSGIAALISLFMVAVVTLSLTGNISLLRTTYKVTFKNYDDTVLSVEKVDKGEDCVYTGEMPERPPVEGFYYVFIGWDRSLLQVNQSFTTYAQYSQVTNTGTGTGTATGDNENGGSQGQTQDNGGRSHTGPGEDTVGGGGEGTGVGGGSGGSGGGGGGGGGGPTQPISDVLQIKTLYSGDVYLRSFSYGTIYAPEENSWEAPETMFNMDNDVTNPLFYTAYKAANVDGLPSRTITLHYTPDDIPLPIPQYPFKFVSTKEMSYRNDRYIYDTYELEQEYVFSPFLYSQANESILLTAPVSSLDASEELRYREYVKENYLYGCDDIQADIEYLYYSNDFGSKTRGQKIEATATVVRNLGMVNNDFVHEDEGTDLGNPISNAFIDNIARAETYANIATFLLRYSDIPARTVKGYKKNTHGSPEFVDVYPDDIYYWTEVYVDGVGWMHIDPIPTVYTDIGTPDPQSGHMPSEDENGKPIKPDAEVLKLTASKSDIYYLRQRSFATYRNNAWGYEDVEPFENASLNPIYYTSDKMNSSGLEPSKVDIEYYIDFLYYPVPEYDAIYNTHYKSDHCAFIEPNNYTYSTSCYSSSFTYEQIIDQLSSVSRINVNETEVASYRDYVYHNYLDVPSELQAGINTFLNSHDLHPGDADLVNKVTNILRDSGEYIYADPEESNENEVLHFLNDSKQGKCTLFASSSTLIYRALGIPCRYTLGVLADARFTEEVTVKGKDGHAWCEIYVDDVGWVMVDNTTGIKVREPVIITPSPIYYSVEPYTTTYDGNPIDSTKLQATLVSDANLAPNHVITNYHLKKNYVDVGTYNVELTLTVIDTLTNKDVSEYYVASTTGIIKINPCHIVITTGSKTRKYDGKPLTDNTFTVSFLADGDVLTLKTTGSITEIGSCDNTLDPTSIQIFHGSKDVSGNYEIDYEYGTLRVT